ncbi:MAG: GNAT family N-acetyltransferase [Halobacteriales archaeon]|nr:GNAT family N-acetyltransferase [Halobacteriales archaeon]
MEQPTEGEVHTFENEIVGWSDATLELDEDDFAYAGKFRVPSGKAVTRDGDETVAVLSFSHDRADPDAVRVRYISVREDRRGEGVGSALLKYAADRLLERHGAVRISVNNPFSYESARKAGFGWTGEESGLAELVMKRPSETDPEMHEEALRIFADRDLSEEEETYVRRKLEEAEGAR